MERQLERLILLQDLCALKRDLASQETFEQFEEMGFEIDRAERIEQAINEVVKELDEEAYEMFNWLAEKYTRPIAAVHRGVCYGCFITLPTSYYDRIRESDELATCEHCGRIIYVVD